MALTSDLGYVRRSELNLSLPVFGEGGRAKRGRVGLTGTAVPWRRPLPEYGEGEERRLVANERARELRKAMTRQEVKLWVRLRELRTLGFHFRRQSPIARYIVDFECRRARVVVEIDANQHGFDAHRIRDETRDLTLKALGYRVLRFTNQEVDRNMDGVLATIHRAIASDLNELHPVELSAAHWAER